MKEFCIDKTLLKKQRRIFYLTLALIIPTDGLILAPLLILHPHSENWLITWILLVVAAWLLSILPIRFLLWRVEKTQITISAEGIRYSSPGISLFSTWDNIEGVRKSSKIKSQHQDDSIVLRKPGKEIRTWWYRLFSRREMLEIPLAIVPDWRSNELGKEIKKYAPRLLK